MPTSTRTFTALGCAFALALSASSLHAAFSESFETGLPAAPGATATGQTLSLASGSWYAVNHSTVIGSTTGVFNSTLGAETFGAYDGVNYAGFDYESTTGANTINAWLITPELSFTAGDTVSFYTRTIAASNYPDRLVVRVSDNGASLNVGVGADDVGDFDLVLGTINPALAVAGYPATYTQFTYTVSFTGSGRIAFQYHITDGGPEGAYGNFIGIDAVSSSASAVPEPASLSAYAGLAFLGFAASRRRRA